MGSAANFIWIEAVDFGAMASFLDGSRFKFMAGLRLGGSWVFPHIQTNFLSAEGDNLGFLPDLVKVATPPYNL